MNRLICSLIVAVGFGTLPEANAETSASTAGRVSVSAAHASGHRVVTRRGRHHRHHRHHHHHRRHHHRR